MPKVRRALISVSDKRGVVELARGLAGAGVELPSTGGTAEPPAGGGIKGKPGSHYPRFPQMPGRRVEAPPPKNHGGLLGRRDHPDHVAAMFRHDIHPIDLVVVNLYPFRE